MLFDLVHVLHSQSLRNVSLQQTADQRLQLKGYSAWKTQFAMFNVVEQRLHVLAKERGLSNHHFIQHTANAVDV